MKSQALLPALLLALVAPLAAAPVLHQEGLAAPTLLAPAERDLLLDGPEILKVSRRAFKLLIADATGDGLQDLIVVSNELSQLEIYRQLKGKGPWFDRFKRETATLDRLVRDAVAMDANGDGRMDVILVGAPATLAIMYQDGNGKLKAPTTTRLEASRILAADIDRDEREDLLVFHEGRFTILKGSAKGLSLEPSQTFFTTGDPAGDVIVADADGDGLRDIIYHDSKNFRDIVFRLQSPEKQFPSEFRETTAELRLLSRFTEERGRRASFAAVQNGTRKAVELVLEPPTKEALKAGALPVSTPQIFPFDPGLKATQVRPYVFDVDGDGRQDVVVVADTSAALYVFRQTRTGALETMSFPSMEKAGALAVVPGNKDGAPAIVTFSSTDRALGWTTWDRKTTSLPFPTLLPGGSDVQTAGAITIQDKVWAAGAKLTKGKDPAFEIALMDPWNPAEPTIISFPLATTGLDANARLTGIDSLDINRDGFADLVVYQEFKPARFLTQSKTGSFTPLTTPSGVLAGLLDKTNPGSLKPIFGLKDGVSILTVKESLARIFTVRGTEEVVIEAQLNPRNAAARFVDGVPVRITGKKQPEIAILDRGNRCVTVYDVTTLSEPIILENLPLDGNDYTGIRAADIDLDGKDDLLLTATNRLAVIYGKPLTGGLGTVASAEPTVEEGAYGKLFPIELTPGGPQFAAIEVEENQLELFTSGRDAEKEPALLRFYQFKMFDNESSIARRSAREAQPEPREVISADLDDDGKAELIALAHDNIIIYYQVPKPKVDGKKK